jgi:hypothetical protein
MAEVGAGESGVVTHTRCILYEKRREPEHDVLAGPADSELWYDERYHDRQQLHNTGYACTRYKDY